MIEPGPQSHRQLGNSLRDLDQSESSLTALHRRLSRIEELLRQLTQQSVNQDCYSTTDIARLLNKSEFTVREWCRLGRIHATKRPCGRGSSQEWMISHEELARIQSTGLLPAKH